MPPIPTSTASTTNAAGRTTPTEPAATATPPAATPHADGRPGDGGERAAQAAGEEPPPGGVHRRPLDELGGHDPPPGVRVRSISAPAAPTSVAASSRPSPSFTSPLARTTPSASTPTSHGVTPMS